MAKKDDAPKETPKQEAGEVLMATPPAGSPRVVWDDTNMRTAYANVCNVVGTREEVILLFGANQTWQGGQSEVRVLLSDRVVLSPFAAKRLHQMLAQGLKEYENRFGELKL
ncbi:MAG TPA: DUF3467 domain-containing protein [Burkholderiales bacterium]